MKLLVKKTIEQEVESDIELPAFFKASAYHVMIREDETVVKVCSTMAFYYKKGEMFYDSSLSEVLVQGYRITEQAFLEEFAKFTAAISDLIQEPEMA